MGGIHSATLKVTRDLSNFLSKYEFNSGLCGSDDGVYHDLMILIILIFFFRQTVRTQGVFFS